MKKLIAIAAIVIASVTTAQVKAQTPIEKICNSIDTFMKAQHPEYAKIERYKVLEIKLNKVVTKSEDGKIDTLLNPEAVFEKGKEPLGVNVEGPFVTLEEYYNDKFSSYLMPYVAPVDYHNNSDKLYLKFVGDIDSEKNKDYGYDLYSFSVIEKDGAKYFILIQDYQVRPTLESVRKQMLEQN
jgi:hypothetical protein